jgi:hypothetical protein
VTHKSSHVIIHKAREFLTAPLPGGGKRWHVALLTLLSGGIGGWFF